MYSKLGTLLLAALLGVALLTVAPPPATSASGSSTARKPAPVVTRLSVSAGPTAGGTTVTITGRHLTKVTKVLFGKTPGRALKTRSATSLRVTSPPHAAGLVQIRVATKHGTSKKVSADRFRYSDWVRTRLPRPADAAFAPRVEESACWDDQRCVAAGAYRQRSGNDAAVLWTLAGTRWSGIRAPIPADAAANPHPLPWQVSCGAAGLCAAYAGYTAHRDGRDVDSDLLWTRTGGTWGVTAPPVPADADPGTSPDIQGVACAGAVCAARGYYEFGGSLRPAFWTLDHGTWKVASAALPADAVRVDLGAIQALACSTGGTCMASGLYLANPGLTSHRVLWRLTASGWTVSEAPAPTGMSYAESLAFGSACGPAVCLATIDLTITGGLATALWTLDEGAWTRTDLPLPPGAQAATGHLLATSCSSSGECVAVGQYRDSGGDLQGGLWVRSAAGTWTATRAAVPADAAQNPRTVVRLLSCSDAGSCVATGSYVHHSNGSDIDDESSYDRLQWTYAGGTWSPRTAIGAHRTQAGPAFTSCGSDFCVRFDGYRTLWTLAGGRWQRFSPGVGLAGLADGAGVAFDASTTEDPLAWVYVG